jgi:signal transduction histidine kinase
MNPAAINDVTGVRLSLWRAAVAFRIASAAFCLYLIVRWHNLYANEALGLAVGCVIALVTVVVAVRGLAGRAHRWSFVVADLAVCLALTLVTYYVQTSDQSHGDMLTLTTVWAAGPVIEAGLVGGWLVGLIAALLQFGASAVVRGGYDGRTLTNGVLLVMVGAISGYICTLTVRSEEEHALLSAQQAALAERERLARTIHDGVLQVLGLVHRKGIAAGGEWATLGRAAAEQEAALRGLITSRRDSSPDAGTRNLAADLALLRSSRRTVSVPGDELNLPAAQAIEVVAIVRAAMSNIDAHAGPDAHTWILLEDLGDRVAITVRDNGVGMPAGRLAQAAQDGRFGVARSIRGRAADLGGTATITSAPGAGTEVEVFIPCPNRAATPDRAAMPDSPS